MFCGFEPKVSTFQMISLNVLLLALPILCFALPTSLGSSRQVYPRKRSNVNSKTLPADAWTPSVTQQSPVKEQQVLSSSSGYPNPNGSLTDSYSSSASYHLNSFSPTGIYLEQNNEAVRRVDPSPPPVDNSQSQGQGHIVLYSHDPHQHIDSYLPQHYQYQNPGHNDLSSHSHLTGYGYGHEDYGGDESVEYEIEDKVFTKTIAATKALKVGKMIFTLCMILIVLILAGLGKAGVALSPAVLPLALLPLGFIALALFVPLFLLYVPIVATGHAGGEKRRRRKKRDSDNRDHAMEEIATVENYVLMFEQRMQALLEKIS